MNGRQRSGAAAAVHHQRQLSDNLLDMSSSNGNRWLQSSGLPNFHPPANVNPTILILFFSIAIWKNPIFKFFEISRKDLVFLDSIFKSNGVNVSD